MVNKIVDCLIGKRFVLTCMVACLTKSASLNVKTLRILGILNYCLLRAQGDCVRLSPSRNYVIIHHL